MCGWAMCVYRGAAGAEEQAVILQQQKNHPDLFKSKTSEEAKDSEIKNSNLSIHFTIADIQVL